jgi:hypothetical protein
MAMIKPGSCTVERRASVPVPPGVGKNWEGWYFEDGYFCSPRGDRLSCLAVMATVMYRQTESVRDLMYWRPSDYSKDVVMHSFLDRPRPSAVHKQDYSIKVSGLTSNDRGFSLLSAE